MSHIPDGWWLTWLKRIANVLLILEKNIFSGSGTHIWTSQCEKLNSQAIYKWKQIIGWSKGGRSRDTSSQGPNYFSLMQFFWEILAKSYVGEGWRPHLGESWISHCRWLCWVVWYSGFTMMSRVTLWCGYIIEMDVEGEGVVQNGSRCIKQCRQKLLLFTIHTTSTIKVTEAASTVNSDT